MADDIRTMYWKIKTTTYREATANVNITDYLRWAKEEGLGEEMNDLSVEDFQTYMTLHGPSYSLQAESDVTDEWEDVEEAR